MRPGKASRAAACGLSFEPLPRDPKSRSEIGIQGRSRSGLEHGHFAHDLVDHARKIADAMSVGLG
jgi:hypothetical protein